MLARALLFWRLMNTIVAPSIRGVLRSLESAVQAVRGGDRVGATSILSLVSPSLRSMALDAADRLLVGKVVSRLRTAAHEAAWAMPEVTALAGYARSG